MKCFDEEMAAAAAKWKATHGDGMTSRELEVARAYYQERRNSRQARHINTVLRERIRKVIVKAITWHPPQRAGGK